MPSMRKCGAAIISGRAAEREREVVAVRCKAAGDLAAQHGEGDVAVGVLVEGDDVAALERVEHAEAPHRATVEDDGALVGKQAG